MSFPEFFGAIKPIVVHDRLARFLGASSDGTIAYHYADVVKLAGHSCPTVAGSFLLARRALRALYPDALPERGELRVRFQRAQVDGTTGVVAAVVGMITGAAGDGGFQGIGGRFRRRDLLSFGEPEQMEEVAFSRIDTGQSVVGSIHLEHVPADPRTRPMLQRLLAGDPDPQLADDFAQLWQERVRRILVDHAEQAELIQLTFSNATGRTVSAAPTIPT